MIFPLIELFDQYFRFYEYVREFSRSLQKQAAQFHAIFKMLRSSSEFVDRLIGLIKPAAQKFGLFQLFFLEL